MACLSEPYIKQDYSIYIENGCFQILLTARPNQFGMPGIVPPYVSSQMLNIPQTPLQAKHAVSTLYSSLLPFVRILSCACWGMNNLKAAEKKEA